MAKLTYRFSGMNRIPCKLNLGFWYNSEHTLRLCKFSDDTRMLIFIWKNRNNSQVISHRVRQYEITVEEYDRLINSLGYPLSTEEYENNLYMTYKRYTPEKAFSPYAYHSF